MNSPITSPWSAVLTSSPTITLTGRRPLAACARASSAPEISLWSVTAIAPSPCARAVASSTSTGVAQSCEWSVCMCRSTSISGRRDRRAASCRRPRASVAARRASRRSARSARRRRRRRRPAGTRRGSGGCISSAVSGRLAVRASRRPKKLSTKRRATSVESRRSRRGVERADVQRARVAQRRVRRARRERLVHVHEVELDRARAVPRSCARRRSAAPLRAAAPRTARRAPRRRRSRAASRRRCPPAAPRRCRAPRAARGASRARAPASATARARARGARAARARRRRARRAR